MLGGGLEPLIMGRARQGSDRVNARVAYDLGYYVAILASPVAVMENVPFCLTLKRYKLFLQGWVLPYNLQPTFIGKVMQAKPG